MVCIDLTDLKPRNVLDMEVPIRIVSFLGDKILIVSGTNTLGLLQSSDNFEVSQAN
jgi:hypothetical protein